MKTLHQSLQEKKAAEAYLVDAQAAEEYATYIVTLGGNELQETDPNPLVSKLLTHAQDLRIKAKEKVTMTTVLWLGVNTITLQWFCFELFASYHLINQSTFFNRKHLKQALKKIQNFLRVLFASAKHWRALSRG